MRKTFTKPWLAGYWLLLLLTVCQMQMAYGQALTVRGKVSDSNGEGLPGVSVLLKGTTTGTTTDNEGRYTLALPDGTGTLLFSYIGYVAEEVAVNNRSVIDISLVQDVKSLGEVVVVGYGTQKKANLTGAVAVVQGEELAKRQVASTSLALQGLAPGVTVTQGSGLPGADAGTIRIRGVGSFQAGQNPLILVDYVEMSLDAIDPNNIESISVLKDAAAAAIYGSRAANGVVLITTKRGKSQGVTVQYNAYGGWQEATNLPEKVDALEHMRLYDIALQNVGQNPAFAQRIAEYEALGPDNFSRFNTDWKKLVLTNNGFMHSHNLNVSAGTDRIKVFASGSFLNQNGLTANTNFKRTDLRFNTDVSLLRNLKASMDLVLNRSDRTWPGGASPNFIVRQMIGLPANIPGKFGDGQYGEGWNNRNPVGQAEASGFDNLVTNSRIITGTLTYQPVEGLEVLATYSSNFFTPHSRRLMKQYRVYTPDLANDVLQPGPLYPDANSISEGISENTNNLFRAQAQYSRTFGKHNLSLLGGGSTETFRIVNMNGFRPNLLDPDKPYLNIGNPLGQTVSGGENRNALASVYSRFNYNFAGKYLFEVNGRWDASSRFRENNQWKLFPSVSAGWRLSEENFWSGLSKVVNDAKIRASYGALGNQALNSFYPTYAEFSAGYNYYFNNAINSGYALTQAANPDIRWETSKQFDVGLDLGLFSNRLTLTADYYQRDVTDMLLTIPIPSMVGLAAPFVNAGSMRNRGWELSTGWRDNIKDFRYQVQFIMSDVQNRVLDFRGQEYIRGGLLTREGFPIDSYYGYIAEGLFQNEEEITNAPFHFANTRPGDVRYRDLSGPEGGPDNKIDNCDRVVLGNSFPRYEYSANLAAQWKGFDLTGFFQGVGKKDNYLSGTGAQAFFSGDFQGTAYQHHKDYWTPENPGASYPRLTVNNDNNFRTSTYWMQSGAYLRLKNLVLGYTLPQALTSRVKVGSVRLYVSGQNLITWDKFYPGFDPEITNSNGEFYPIMKTYNIGLNVKL